MKHFVILWVLFTSVAQAQEPPNADPTVHAWQIIDQAIANKDPDKRQLIVEAASLGGARPKVFAFLDKAAADKSVQVRMATCTSLASLKDPGSVPILKKLIQDKVPEIVFCSAQALFSLGEPEGEEALLEILTGKQKTGSGFFSAHQREVLSTFNSKKRFFSTLFRLGIRFAPVPGLAMGVSSMESLMADKGAPGRTIAAIAFAKGNDAATLQALVDSLKDKNALVRAAAVHSLALRDDPSVMGELVPLMDDKNDKVSYRAAVAYLRLGKIKEDAAAAGKAEAPGSAAATPTDLEASGKKAKAPR